MENRLRPFARYAGCREEPRTCETGRHCAYCFEVVFPPTRVYIPGTATEASRTTGGNWRYGRIERRIQARLFGYIIVKVSSESWFKVSLSALPVAFTVFGVWVYWHEDPLRLLAPNIAFWGVVLEFYLFSNLQVPASRAPFYFSISSALLWLVSAITTHNLVRALASNPKAGVMFELGSKDFWFAYVAAAIGCGFRCGGFLSSSP